jgi:hypothetical protein
MSVFNEKQKAAINFLITFDAKDAAHQTNQHDDFIARFDDVRLGCQSIANAIEGMTGKQIAAFLKKEKLNTLIKKDGTYDRVLVAAYRAIAGALGGKMRRAAKSGKLGKVCTIRGAHTTGKKLFPDLVNSTKAKRSGKSGQGKQTKKQVSFTAKNKPTTIAAKLELLEKVAEANGFSFVEFVAEWQDEAIEPAIQKVA